MEFHVLGPLEVLHGEGRISLGGPRHRSLLALLLVRPCEVISVDQLADALWTEGIPRRASEMLHVRVSELRRSLGAGADRVVTRRPGYLLRVDEDELDTQRFQRHATSGRAALVGGDPVTAERELRAALALWRGPVLPEISDRLIARPEIYRLERLRLQVLEDHVQSELDLGRHLDVIGETETLTAEDPLRERFWWQRMLALYRASRQAEALRVYQQVCAHLAAELGIDPGPELRQLHTAILRQDPALDLTGLPIAIRGRTPNNLPARLTSFVGRREELAEISALLGTARLVTLTGVGGCGKSRLATEIAAAQLDTYPDGVWIVELAVLSDPLLITSTIAKVLGIHEHPDRQLLDLVLERLREARTLVVLDNCEHLVEGVADLVGELLGHCSEVRVLCTSRELLGIQGEVLRSVPGLGTSDAVRMFADRARAVRAGFELTDTTTGDVAEICRRLDGLPLGIELAAASTSTFCPARILAGLDDCFGLLAKGKRLISARHRTLHAVVGWSYELLDEQERLVFEQLSVFVGSFTFEAAAAICVATDIADLLDRLIGKSLLIAESVAPREYRYRLLEVLRVFGMEKLSLRGQVDLVRARHAEFFRALTELAGAGLRGREQARWLDCLGEEHTNLRAALEFSLGRGDAETAAKLAGSIYPFWDLRGHYSEGRQWLSRVLTVGRNISVPSRTRVLMAATTLAVIQGDFESAGMSAGEAVLLGRQAREAAGVAHALSYLGLMAIHTGELDRAASLLHESLDTASAVGAGWERAWALVFLAVLALADRDCDRALDVTERAEAALETVGDPEALGWVLVIRAAADWHMLNTSRAATEVQAGLNVFGDLGALWGTSTGLLVTALVVGTSGQHEVSARLLGAAEALRDSIGGALLAVAQDWRDAGMAEATAALGPESFRHAWCAGQMMSPEAALAEARTALDSYGASTAHCTIQS